MVNRPASGGGTSGSSGNCSNAMDVETLSGNDSHHCRQACTTAAASETSK